MELDLPRLLFDRREVVLRGEVDEELADLVCDCLFALDRMNQEPIALIIDSPGGEVEAGLKIFDCIRSMISAPVVGKVFGHACSIAAVILQACGERQICQHSHMHIHPPMMGGLTAREMVDSTHQHHAKVHERITLDSLTSHTGCKRKKVIRLAHADTELSAKKALKLGLVDKII